MRVVLDTSVLVSASRSRNGASFEIVSRLGHDEFEIVISVPLILEYESALLRQVEPGSSWKETDVGDFVDYLCDVGEAQEVFFLWRPFLRDPGDDMVLELAVAAACDAIVTHNIRDFRGAEQLNVRVLTPRQFLQELRG